MFKQINFGPPRIHTNQWQQQKLKCRKRSYKIPLQLDKNCWNNFFENCCNPCLPTRLGISPSSSTPRTRTHLRKLFARHLSLTYTPILNKNALRKYTLHILCEGLSKSFLTHLGVTKRHVNQPVPIWVVDVGTSLRVARSKRNDGRCPRFTRTVEPSSRISGDLRGSQWFFRRSCILKKTFPWKKVI